MNASTIPTFLSAINPPLPGREAQIKMANVFRVQAMKAPSNARIACVLALFYPKNGVWHLVLGERTSNDNPNDRHSGQVSFPGGKLEPTDTSYEAGALRETQEEIGVEPTDINVVSSLTELYIPVSNFMVYPFVGYVEEEPQFIAQESEVANIIEVPLSEMLDERNRKVMDMKISDKMILKDVPYFDWQGYVVWGATAMILSELIEVISKKEES